MKAFSGVSSISDIRELEAESPTVDLPKSTYELLCQGQAINPDAPALSFFMDVEDHEHPLTWTYREMLRKIRQTANFFDALGVSGDSVIAYILPNLPETHWVIWGGQASGIVCAINPMLEPVAIAELLNAAKAQVLVTLAPFPGTELWPKVCSILPALHDLQHVVLVNLADQVPAHKSDIARRLQLQEIAKQHGDHGIAGALPPGVQVHDFNTSIELQPGDVLRSQRLIHPDDISSYFCTGGTTGTPKLAMRRHRNEVANALQAAQHLGNAMGPEKNIFCGLPLFHVNAVLVTGLLPFSRGAHVILGTPQGYRGQGLISQFWEIVERHRINFFSGVPTLYAGLLQVPVGERDISSLEYGLCGAAPMPVEVFRNFQERTGVKILEGYGLTEGTCVSSVNPPAGERRLGSIGLRIPGQLMKAVLVDERGSYLRDCEPEEVGLLVISGPNVFAGYKTPEHNRGLWVEQGDGRQWLNTGDLGRQDEQGYFWLTGRKKELIIRGGHNIDPAIIEAPLHRHPAVHLAAAVGRPDAHTGELPVAYVQLKPGSVVTEQELMDFLKSEITERAALPKRVHVVDNIPLTAVGKIFKTALKHREITEVLTTELQQANVRFSALMVEEDKLRGTLICVTVEHANAEVHVKEVLGRYPFAIEVSFP